MTGEPERSSFDEELDCLEAAASIWGVGSAQVAESSPSYPESGTVINALHTLRRFLSEGLGTYLPSLAW